MHRSRFHLHACLLAAVLGLLAGRCPASAADGVAPEYQVKATFLFNFAKFTDWPTNRFSSPTAPFIVGILGQDPFGELLDQTLAGQVVGARSFVVRRFKPGEDPGACHILFIARSEKAHIASVITILRDQPVLTVSEIDRFAQLGGVVNFSLISGKVKLEINPAAAQKAGLQLSSKLLGVAKVVRTEAVK